MNVSTRGATVKNTFAKRTLLCAAGLCGALAFGCEDRPTDLTIAASTGDSCLEVRTWPGQGPTTQYIRKTWDSGRRTLSQEISSTATFPGHVDLAWRYGLTGNVVAYAGFATEVPSYGNFQQDYLYDDHDNTVDFRLSYPDHPDLMVPSPADTWFGLTYRNEYDSQGRLVTYTRTPYGGGTAGVEATYTAFHEDDRGRCDRTETGPSAGAPPTSVETLTYDAADRLIRSEKRASDAFPCPAYISLLSYDAEGRVTVERAWCQENTTGQPHFVRNTSYLADGSQRIESLDFINDTPNDVIVDEDGIQRSVTHWIQTRSATCATLDSFIAPPAGANPNRCRVP